MCGRYTEAKLEAVLRKRFRFAETDVTLVPRYNIAPSQEAPIVGGHPDRKLALFRWGLVPSWAREEGGGAKRINARAETLSERPSFREAFLARRCLVLADGFYEWRKTPSGKVPVHVRLPSGEPFAFAGLWERWRRPDRTSLFTFTIVTTAPNELMRPIHDRMPAILTPEAEDAWLDPRRDPASLSALLVPYPGALVAQDVSTLVNSPRHDEPACVAPV